MASMSSASDMEQQQGSSTHRILKDEVETIQSHIEFGGSALSGLLDWCSYPEVPTSRDLNPDWNNPEDLARINSLLPNNWQQPFPDKNTYLETHYRLQREEAISLLRYSINQYREDPTMMDDEDTYVYTRVHVQGYMMTRLGPMCRVQVSTARAGKRVNWAQTRRLTPGSLVAISTARDGFKTICKPAIVADRYIPDGLDPSPPSVQIFWADMNDAVLDPTEELIMLEGRQGYFEAVRYCMVGLQHVAATSTPFDKYLVSLDKSDLVAPYVRKNPEMNLSSLVHHIPGSAELPVGLVRQRLAETRQSMGRYQVLDGISREVLPYTNLDNSQLSAVHRILTKELSIIQGPPGTGKTFTSVQALRILLESRNQLESGCNVIIVAAQTNHAVDQILTLLINLGFDNTVRVGGRTQDEFIKEHNMYNLRRRTKHSQGGDYKRFEAERQKNITRIQNLISSIFSEDLIDPEALQSAGIITQKQFDSLLKNDEWTATENSDATTNAGATSGPEFMSLWLGDQCIEAPSIDTCDPDFDIQEDDDLDFSPEDYGPDLDDFIADEEVKHDRVFGKWVPIKHKWTGANPRKHTKSTPMICQELERDNLWEVGKQYRGAIYQHWQHELLCLRLAEFRSAMVDNARICRNLKIQGWRRDLLCIKKAGIQIVGCTTTGLCKYRGLLAALKPRTMLIEEAAETKEANILSALYPSLQQLILVGDHQQLAPSCSTPGLDGHPYFLGVSMFERLVKLQMPYTMLDMQRRMNPVLREVLSPFYPALRDHPVVIEPGARPAIPGMEPQSFMFDHTWAEGTDENLSKFNLLEATMIAHFINYLLLNGVKQTEITVLTFYRGQRKKILAECRRATHHEPFTNVKTVDSYQGEENDIVILSLVRSNDPGGPYKAGFLKNSNRGVVSISRARRGFYIFGNMTNLLYAGDESRRMWGRVCDVFRRQNRFGDKLPVTCQQHGRTTLISHPEDWINNHGGCDILCPGRLECGHDCGRLCHWIPHNQLICGKPCEKSLRCGHPCEVACGEDCRCRCASFTGAFPNDASWDDDKVANVSKRNVAASRGLPRSFIPDTGRVGRLRESHRGRGGSARGGRSGQQGGTISNARGSSARPNMLAEGWAKFDARQHDAQRRQERQEDQRPAESRTPNPLRHNAADITSSIHETFRRVTLDQRGQRHVEGATLENIGSPLSANGARSYSNFDVHTDSAYPIPMQPRSTVAFSTMTGDFRDNPLEADPELLPSDIVLRRHPRGGGSTEWEMG